MTDIIPLFDIVILLQVSSDILRERLSKRTLENPKDIGNTKQGRQWILDGKDSFEKKAQEMGALVIGADADTREITKQIIEVINQQH